MTTSSTRESTSTIIAVAELIVLSSHIWPGDRFGYDEVSNWPAFESYLAIHYQVVRQYGSPAADRYIAGYRTYMRCDSSFQQPLAHDL